MKATGSLYSTEGEFEFVGIRIMGIPQFILFVRLRKHFFSSTFGRFHIAHTKGIKFYSLKFILSHIFLLCLKLGERIIDYMNMDERSIGMFWVVSYTMAQPACETVMNWLTSAGVTEGISGPNLQSNERLMVMQEVSPVPMSLISGFSINLCLKLVYQMEESMFSGQVKWLLYFFLSLSHAS